jgi:hypothetical protein
VNFVGYFALLVFRIVSRQNEISSFGVVTLTPFWYMAILSGVELNNFL